MEHYLFVYDDGNIFETDAASLKDAVWMLAKYTGSDRDTLKKSLNGFEETDAEGIIKLYEALSMNTIYAVHIVKETPFDRLKREMAAKKCE